VYFCGYLIKERVSMKRFPLLLGLCLLIVSLMACDKTETYADQLAIEKSTIKAFMTDSGYTVTTVYPDTIPFPDGVFYKNKEGLYIHVIDTGHSVIKNIPKNTSYEVRYFELNLSTKDVRHNMNGVSGNALSIYYNNIQTTVSFGDCKAWHQALSYVGDGGHVYLIVPTSLGMSVYSSTTKSLTPCFYELRYTLSQQ
jgi:Domain of unknown function (DUF4827)